MSLLNVGARALLANQLALHACPFQVEGFAVRQHWHARYHHDAGSRWLREVVSQLFGHGEGPRSGRSGAAPSIG